MITILIYIVLVTMAGIITYIADDIIDGREVNGIGLILTNWIGWSAFLILLYHQ